MIDFESAKNLKAGDVAYNGAFKTTVTKLLSVDEASRVVRVEVTDGRDDFSFLSTSDDWSLTRG